MKACKRGNIAPRDKWGHCLCQDCKAHRKETQQKQVGRVEYQRKWNALNKEKLSGYSKKWRDNNKEQRTAIVSAWREKNPDKVKSMSNKAGKRWAKTNLGKRNAINSKRRTALLQRCPKWADLEKIQMVYVEAQRITLETGIPHEVDHIFPLQGLTASGLHVPSNLRIITRYENRSKQNLAPEP